jgi:hypothetical protein
MTSRRWSPARTSTGRRVLRGGESPQVLRRARRRPLAALGGQPVARADRRPADRHRRALARAHGSTAGSQRRPERRFRAAVTFDRLRPPGPDGVPSVPTLFQQQDLSDLPHLGNADELPGDQDAAAFSAAGVPTGSCTSRGRRTTSGATSRRSSSPPWAGLPRRQARRAALRRRLVRPVAQARNAGPTRAAVTGLDLQRFHRRLLARGGPLGPGDAAHGLPAHRRGDDAGAPLPAVPLLDRRPGAAAPTCEPAAVSGVLDRLRLSAVPRGEATPRAVITAGEPTASEGAAAFRTEPGAESPHRAASVGGGARSAGGRSGAPASVTARRQRRSSPAAAAAEVPQPGGARRRGLPSTVAEHHRCTVRSGAEQPDEQVSGRGRCPRSRGARVREGPPSSRRGRPAGVRPARGSSALTFGRVRAQAREPRVRPTSASSCSATRLRNRARSWAPPAR